MNENIMEKNEEIEIDLQRLFVAVWNKAWLVGLVAGVCAVVTLLGTLLFVTPKYQSSAMFYVNNNSLSLGEASLSITSADISASRGLVKSYIVILNTRESLNDVIDYAGVNRTYAELKKMIEAESVDATEIFQVVVTSDDPKEAEAIADAIAYILPKRISSIIEGTSAKVVDSAVVPSKPSSPSYTNNTILGFLLGLVITVAVIVLQELFDITIRTEEDIAQSCDCPMLAAVPDMQTRGKGSAYGYGKKTAAAEGTRQPVLVGAGISFAASEAYKLLRTKLQYSFAGDGNCRVIGISSDLTGEGKSLTAVNLAYVLSELGERVLLMDCDMRRPSVSSKLPVKKKPGLSGYLSGQVQVDSLIQPCGIPGEERAFHVIAAGQNPPNPIELLSSARMEKLLDALRGYYDYILLDLPPVGEVSDALAVSRNVDGVLLVVRQNYSNRTALANAVRQFRFVDTKILGIIFNCVNDGGSRYGKGYYKKYYQKAYTAYGEAENARKAKTARTEK